MVIAAIVGLVVFGIRSWDPGSPGVGAENVNPAQIRMCTVNGGSVADCARVSSIGPHLAPSVEAVAIGLVAGLGLFLVVAAIGVLRRRASAGEAQGGNPDSPGRPT